MVLRVKPIPTRLPTNSLYTPMDNIPLHSKSSVRHPWGNYGHYTTHLGWGLQTRFQKGKLSCQRLAVYFHAKKLLYLSFEKTFT